MDEAVRRTKEHGHDEVAIFVDNDNEELKDWYTKQGFEQSGIYRSMWKKIS